MNRRLLIALTSLAVLGCGAGETAGPDAKEWTFNGTWRGGFVGETASLSAVLTLAEQDTLLTGAGTISGSGVECAVSIDGARSGEKVALEIRCGAYAPIHYRGNRTGATRIVGQVFGSGLPVSDMDLTKQ